MTLSKSFALTAAALAVALPGAAFAEAHSAATTMNSGRLAPADMETMMRSSDLIGSTVYTMVTADATTGDDWSMVGTFDAIGDGWESIGTVQEVVLSHDGQLTGFIVEDGGFLGFGGDSVLLATSALRLIENTDGDIAWVTNITQAQFDAMPQVEDNWF